VVKGNQFTPYINKDKLMTVTNDKIKNGILGFMVSQESGKTECKFSNSCWLWLPGSEDSASGGQLG
jgi:hypothetical protein